MECIYADASDMHRDWTSNVSSHKRGGTPWSPEQMIKALRQAIPEMLRNIPKLVAGPAAEDNEGADHVH